MAAGDVLNKIYLGEVANVHNYGAFVKLPGGNKLQGLVHRSQVSSTPVEDVQEVLHKGDRVWCKVINIQEDGKLSLSMKVVDQGNGTDLDPAGVTIHQDEMRRKQRPDGNRKKAIVLEAVLNTTCTKCNTRGHLAKDCFKSVDGKTYELIPEDDDVPEVPQPPVIAEGGGGKKKKKEKKEKKSKKEKKHKKKRRRSSSTSSSSSEQDSEKVKKKKRKKKRERSRSRSPPRKH